MLGIIRIFLIVLSFTSIYNGVVNLDATDYKAYLLFADWCLLMIIALILYEHTGVHLVI